MLQSCFVGIRNVPVIVHMHVYQVGPGLSQDLLTSKQELKR